MPISVFKVLLLQCDHLSKKESLLRGDDVQKNEHSTISTDPVSLYRELTHLTPNRAQRELIDDDVSDLDAWRSAVQHWLGHGWNPRNIPGMLDLYQRGGPPGCRYCSKASLAANRTPLEEAFAILDRIASEEPDGEP